MTMSMKRSTICVQIFFGLISVQLCLALTISDADLQKAMLSLWDSDLNYATDDQLDLDYQGHTNTGDRIDQAPRNLFRNVDKTLLDKPTYKALIDLFDAYSSPSATKLTAGAKISAFFDRIQETGPYKALQKFLADQGYQPAKNAQTFREALTEIWFGDYARGSTGQSSGFEHVFVGETKNGQVSGLHNWVRLYWLESKNQLDYTGFIVKRPRIAIIQYKIGSAYKPSGSVMMGTSPEFDFSVFTLCFLGKQGEDACKFFLGDCSPVEVSSYPYVTRGKTYIGTVYPSPWKTNDRCPYNGSG